MRPATVTTTGVSVSPVIPLDYIQVPFAVGLAAIVTGTATYTIQHTFSDIFASTYNPATDTWFSHDDSVFVSSSINANSNFSFPVRGVRINQTAGSGGVSLEALQGIGG